MCVCVCAREMWLTGKGEIKVMKIKCVWGGWMGGIGIMEGQNQSMGLGIGHLSVDWALRTTEVG